MSWFQIDNTSWSHLLLRSLENFSSIVGPIWLSFSQLGPFCRHYPRKLRYEKYVILPYKIGLIHLRQTRYSTNLRHKHVPYDALVYFLRIPMFYKFSSLQHNSNHFKSILNQTKNDYIQESKCRSSSLCFALSVSVLLSLWLFARLPVCCHLSFFESTGDVGLADMSQ